MRRLILPLLILIAAVAFWLVLRPLIAPVLDGNTGFSPEDLDRFSQTLIWLAAGFLVVRIVDRVIWEGWLRGRVQRETPELLRTVSSALLWLLVLIGVVSIVFGQSVTGLLTASSVVVAVIGFAARQLIGDLFFGIALAVERPFNVGDWVRLEDGTEGEVVEMNWRATHLITRRKMYVVIPNGVMASSRFENFYRPERFFRESFTVRLDYDITGYQAERLLLSAVRQVPESYSLPEPPEVRVEELLPDGVVWEVRFWVPNRPDRTTIKTKIQRHLLRNLFFAGVEVARERAELIVDTVDKLQKRRPQTADSWLSRIDLFAALDPEELADLERKAKPMLCRAGEVIVRTGEEGSSLFVLVEGALKVTPGDGESEETVLAYLDPGRFFGEMSLLTGEPRGATVAAVIDSRVYEITKSDLAPLLEQRPEIANLMSSFLAERQLATQSVLADRDREPTTEDRETLAGQFLQQIYRFFDTGFLKSLTRSHKETIGSLSDRAFLEAAMAAAAMVAIADGSIDAAERAEIADVFGSIDIFRNHDRAEGLGHFDRHVEALRSGDADAERLVMKMVRPIAARPGDARIILRLCCAVGAADGQVLEPERGAIRRLCRTLDILPEEFGILEA